MLLLAHGYASVADCMHASTCSILAHNYITQLIPTSSIRAASNTRLIYDVAVKVVAEELAGLGIRQIELGKAGVTFW